MKLLRNHRGQLIIEYILLLVISVTLALMITKALVNRNADNPGVLIARWHRMLNMIGLDYADGPDEPGK